MTSSRKGPISKLRNRSLYNTQRISRSTGASAQFNPSFSITYSTLGALILSFAPCRSTACGALKPTCILVPSTAEEVSTIVSTLHQNNESFAFKSAGHNANRGFASIDGGPLINLKKLDEVNYDPETQAAQIGPGNRWTKVIKTLEPYNRTAVGGRIGHVGVGGYMTGGMFSPSEITVG